MKQPNRDLLPWITIEEDYAPRERRHVSLFDAAPHWLVMTVTWGLILLVCVAFWALVLVQLEKQL